MSENDERLQQAVRAGAIGIFDHDHGTDVIYWSPELRKFYGFAPDELVTMHTIGAQCHPDDSERIMHAVIRAHSPDGDGSFDVEHRIFDRTGQLRWLLTRSKTLFAGVGAEKRPLRTIGAVQDVTDRRHASAQLRILDTVIRSSGRAVAIADPSGRLTFANQAFVRFWGHEREEDVIDRSLFEFWEPSEGPGEAIAEIFRKGTWHTETVGRRRNGEAFDVEVVAEAVCDARGQLAQVLATFTDITASKRVAQALRLKDQAIASSLGAIAMSDPSERIVYANPAFVKLWGHTSDDEVLGRSPLEFGDAQQIAKVLDSVRAHGSWVGEVAGKHRDGAAMQLRLSAHSISDSDGQLLNVVATFVDVTEQKRLEAQLLHAQKMESVGRLAGGVAHDFNNLLTVILGGIELTRQELGPRHPALEYLADAENAADSAGLLTKQLLAFSRKQIIAPEVLSLNDVIGRVERMVQRLLGEDVVLRTICSPNLGFVRFDPSQVEQILINLAVNARDAMPEGGRLTVETRNVRLDEGYVDGHARVEPGDYVLLAVSDSGTGMSEDARAHLFEPFFTTKEPGKGTGLGLAMVYGAVQQNGGRIEVYSEPEHGTTFKIYLPRISSIQRETRALDRESPRSGGESILLVEDDERVRSFAKTVLERFGYEVHAFPAPAHALAALPDLTPAPDLLVTDVVMPGMNGRVLSERVASLVPSMRVLFVSGYTENVIVHHGVLKDDIEFLAKPYSVDQLARRVREVLDATPRNLRARLSVVT
ncbi:MAG TPA: PAS domain S-box protein [Polyangiaceae bacterium]|nr:PAS domain S-box protein [Polyangiaceae bacterium]